MTLATIHWNNNAIKHNAFLHGYIEGIQSDGRVCDVEIEGFLAELETAYRKFPSLTDVADMIMDIKSKCFTDQADINTALNDLKDALVARKNWDTNPHAYRNRVLGMLSGIKADGVVLSVEHVSTKELAMTLDHSDFLREVLSMNVEDFEKVVRLLVGNGFANEGIGSLETPSFFDQLQMVPVNLNGLKIVLTGIGGEYTRVELSAMINACGGRVMTAVSNKTDFLVVLNEGSTHWTTTHFGNKIEKAIAKNVTLMSEHALMESILQC